MKKKALIIPLLFLFAAITILALTACGGDVCEHRNADVVCTARVEPTCTTAGNIEYWKCTDCNKYFSDSALTNPISIADMFLPAQHKSSGVVKHARVEPTCTAAGNIEYWECTACDKYFSDSALVTEVEKSSAILPSGGHNFDTANYCAVCDYQQGTDGIIYTSGVGGYYVTGIGTAKGNVVIANKVNDLPVVGIHSQAFINCLDLTSISIPSTVTYIEAEAFSGCENLTSVKFADNSRLNSLGENAFYNCSRLTSVTIPNSVTSIGSYAFWGCSGLKGVYITDIAKWCNISFGDPAANPLFYARKLYLSGNLVTNLVIPNGVTKIGSYALWYCSGLTSITIPNSVTSIGDSAFWYCSGLTSITIPSGVTTISDNAFCGCSGLTSITIPNNVTTIGDWAFHNCSGLTSITIPNSVTNIGSSAFNGCSGLTSITIPNSVTTIGSYAFSGCSKLTSITIPNSVTAIGGGAFEGCSGLTSITLPFVGATKDGTSNTHFGYIFGAFSYSDNSSSVPAALKSVIITGSRGIDGNAFYGCSKLTSITIPNSVTAIGGGAFEGCSGLTSITIPNSVTSISNYAFYGCSGLTSITLPFVGETDDGTRNTNFGYIFGASNLTSNSTYVPAALKSVIITGGRSIDRYAFYGCSGLTSINIPSSVTSIGSRAFEGCSGLTSVTIGDGVTSIERYAFEGCSGLTSVTFENPNGWSCSYSLSGTRESISATSLSDTGTAADYLASTYCNYYWWRS